MFIPPSSLSSVPDVVAFAGVIAATVLGLPLGIPAVLSGAVGLRLNHVDVDSDRVRRSSTVPPGRVGNPRGSIM
jgi:hypothetical protein